MRTMCGYYFLRFIFRFFFCRRKKREFHSQFRFLFGVEDFRSFLISWLSPLLMCNLLKSYCCVCVTGFKCWNNKPLKHEIRTNSSVFCFLRWTNKIFFFSLVVRSEWTAVTSAAAYSLRVRYYFEYRSSCQIVWGDRCSQFQFGMFFFLLFIFFPFIRYTNRWTVKSHLCPVWPNDEAIVLLSFWQFRFCGWQPKWHNGPCVRNKTKNTNSNVSQCFQVAKYWMTESIWIAKWVPHKFHFNIFGFHLEKKNYSSVYTKFILIIHQHTSNYNSHAYQWGDRKYFVERPQFGNRWNHSFPNFMSQRETVYESMEKHN